MNFHHVGRRVHDDRLRSSCTDKANDLWWFLAIIVIIYQKKSYKINNIQYYRSTRLAQESLFSTIDCLTVRGYPSVCLPRSFKSLLLFCFSMESSHFGPSVLHVALYKTLFFDFYARQHKAVARICHANFVCLSVCPSVCHTRVLYQNG